MRTELLQGSWPVYPNLVGMVVLSANGGSPSDAFWNQQGTRSGASAPTWGGYDLQGHGHAMRFNGGGSGNSFLDFGARAAFRDLGISGSSLAPVTFIARLKWNGGNSGIAERNDNNTIQAGWLFGIASNGNLCYLHERSVLNFRYSVGSVPSGVYTTVAAAFFNDTTGCSMYVDGVHQGTGVDNTGSGNTGTDSANGFVLGNCQFGFAPAFSASSFNGEIAWFAAFNRYLSHAEIAAWSRPAEPWRFFPSSPHAARAEGGGGGGPEPGTPDHIYSGRGSRRNLSRRVA